MQWRETIEPNMLSARLGGFFILKAEHKVNFGRLIKRILHKINV